MHCTNKLKIELSDFLQGQSITEDDMDYLAGAMEFVLSTMENVTPSTKDEDAPTMHELEQWEGVADSIMDMCSTKTFEIGRDNVLSWLAGISRHADAYLIDQTHPNENTLPTTTSNRLQNGKDDDTETLKKLKKKIVSQFAVQAVPVHPVTCKPPPIQSEQKTMMRYRDNQVVTTRGEKVIVEKEVMTDKMKAT